VKDLDDKVDKNIKTMGRDINMSKKKLNRLVSKTNKLEKAQSGDEGDHGGSKKSLHDKKMSFDIQNNSGRNRSLIPKLPFMKAGNRIASFG